MSVTPRKGAPLHAILIPGAGMDFARCVGMGKKKTWGSCVGIKCSDLQVTYITHVTSTCNPLARASLANLKKQAMNDNLPTYLEEEK